MRLNALLIADAVSAPPDGKFYIHGGGLTRLTVPAFPFPVPQLGVFVRLEIEEHEVGEMHEFAFEFTDPDGDPVGPGARFEAQIPPPLPGFPELEEGEQRFVVLALNIGGISVGRRGLHTFAFRVDGEALGTVPLPVTVLSPEQLQAATTPPMIRPPSDPAAPNPSPPRRRPPPPPRRRAR